MTEDAVVQAMQKFDQRLGRVEADISELADVVLGTKIGHLTRAEDGLKNVLDQVKQCMGSVKEDVAELRNGKKQNGAAVWTYRATVSAALVTAVASLLVAVLT